MGYEQHRDIAERAETKAVHMQAEWPMGGTALNPQEEAWVFDENASAAPVDELAGSMQQGE